MRKVSGILACGLTTFLICSVLLFYTLFVSERNSITIATLILSLTLVFLVCLFRFYRIDWPAVLLLFFLLVPEMLKSLLRTAWIALNLCVCVFLFVFSHVVDTVTVSDWFYQLLVQVCILSSLTKLCYLLVHHSDICVSGTHMYKIQHSNCMI